MTQVTTVAAPVSPVTRWEVIDRGLALLGDALVVGIVVVAVQLGLLDRTAGIAVIGWALRALVTPSLSFTKSGIGLAVGARTGAEPPS